MAINEVTSIDVKTLPPFKRLIMTLGELPTSYLESMTYAELLMWFCNFLQEKVLPTINNNADALQEVITYLENLDLQDEVNNKLDEMAESGQLQEIVAEYLNANALWCFDTVEDMKSAPNLINGSYAKTLGFYELNDGGSATYKIREITNDDIVDNISIIPLDDNTLIAVLNEKDSINVKQLGAYGDNTHDDKNAIQYAISNYKDIYIPTGTYKITDEITLSSNIKIHGDGQSSIIKMVYTYLDTVKYCFKFNDGELFLYRTLIEDLKFVVDDVTQYTGGIYISSALRGNVLNNLWFEQISNPIYLGSKIWALFSLNNIFSTYLPGATVVNESIPVGIYGAGNCIYGTNIEICGKFKYGIYLNGASVSSFTKTNVSGSGTTYMKTAYYVIGSKQININTTWIEQCVDENGTQNTKAINIVNSNNVKIDNVHLASGSCYIDNSYDVRLTGIKYYTNSSGLRWLNGSKLTCDKLSLGFCNFQNDRSLSMGHVDVIDIPNESNVNIFNDPLQLKGLTQMIAQSHTNVTVTENTTDQLTGDRCFTISVPTSGRGTSTYLNNLTIGKNYTILAFVKILENCNYLYATAINGTIIGDFPNNYVINKSTNNWELIKYSFTATATTHDLRILVNCDDDVTATYLVDSIFCIEGLHNFNIPSGLTKKAIMQNSKVYKSSAPSSGNWVIGDIVYNSFTNATYNNVEYWIYDGTQWVAKNIS